MLKSLKENLKAFLLIRMRSAYLSSISAIESRKAYLTTRRLYNAHFSGLKVGRLPTRAIGHLILYAEMHFKFASAFGLDPLSDLVLICPSKPANDYMLKLYRKHLNIIENDELYDALSSGGMDYLEDIDAALPDGFRNGVEFLSQVKVPLSICQSDLERGQEIARRLGLDPSRPFALVCVRDDYYYKELVKGHRQNDCYRNTSFNSFYESISLLKQRGIQVVRTGHYQYDDDAETIGYISTKSLPSDEHQLMDAFLYSRCLFAACGGSGAAYLPYAFSKPILAHNWIPIRNVALIHQGVVVPRLIVDRNTKVPIPFRQLIQLEVDVFDQNRRISLRGDHFTADALYDRFGMQTLQNSASELRAATEEILELLAGSNSKINFDHRTQLDFRTVFPAGHPIRTFNGVISPHFLSTYPATYEKANPQSHANLK